MLLNIILWGKCKTKDQIIRLKIVNGLFALKGPFIKMSSISFKEEREGAQIVVYILTPLCDTSNENVSLFLSGYLSLHVGYMIIDSPYGVSSCTYVGT